MSIVRAGEDDGREPDFLLCANGEAMGVELTEIFKDSDAYHPTGSRQKTGEALRRRALGHTAKDYYAQGGAPIKVKLLAPVRIEHPMQTAAELIEHSSRLQEWGRSRVQLDDMWMEIQRLPAICGSYDRWEIVPDRMGWSRQITHELLQNSVAEKLGKVEAYRRCGARVCLLLYANLMQRSGMMYLDDTLRIEPQGFKAVYLYLHPGTAKQIG